MTQRRHLKILCAIAIGALVASPGETANIERVVVGAHDTYTRLVFHFDEAADFSQYWDASGRPVIALPNVSAVGPQPDFNLRHAPAVGLTYTLSDEGLDAVIVTDGPVKATSFVLTPDSYGGHRVVIDISRTGQATGSIGGSPNMRRLDPAADPQEALSQAPAVAQIEPATPVDQSAPIEPDATTAVEPADPAPLVPSATAAPTPLGQAIQPNVPPLAAPPEPAAVTAAQQPPAPAAQKAPRTQLSALETDVCAGTAGRLQMDRWDMGALINHGICLSEAGRLIDARRVLERILSFDPEFHRARLALADVYKRQGEIARAKEAYEYVLLTSPPADVTKRIQMALRELRPRETPTAAALR